MTSRSTRTAWRLVALAAFLVPGAQVVAQATRQPTPRTVIIDAGHGGVDKGMSGITARGVRIHEKDIALGVATKVAARLHGAGVKVVMTRKRDTLVALPDRGRIANREQGDLFISVHVNAANRNWRDPSAARGFETYFLAEARTEDERRVAAFENEAARFDDASDAAPGDAMSFMLTDMAQNAHLRESSDLATTIQSQLNRSHPGPNRGVKQGNLMVLATTFMPAVLVEIGFGSNPTEASWLASSSGQAELADAITRATLDYLARFERRSGGSRSRK